MKNREAHFFMNVLFLNIEPDLVFENAIRNNQENLSLFIFLIIIICIMFYSIQKATRKNKVIPIVQTI